MRPDEIYRLRVDSGLTLAQISQLVGVTHTTYSRWEQGVNSPAPMYLATLQQLRAKLNEMTLQQIPRNEIAERIAGFIVAGGIIAFLLWVFNRSDN